MGNREFLATLWNADPSTSGRNRSRAAAASAIIRTLAATRKANSSCRDESWILPLRSVLNELQQQPGAEPGWALGKVGLGQGGLVAAYPGCAGYVQVGPPGLVHELLDKQRADRGGAVAAAGVLHVGELAAHLLPEVIIPDGELPQPLAGPVARFD